MFVLSMAWFYGHLKALPNQWHQETLRTNQVISLQDVHRFFKMHIVSRFYRVSFLRLPCLCVWNFALDSYRMDSGAFISERQILSVTALSLVDCVVLSHTLLLCVTQLPLLTVHFWTIISIVYLLTQMCVCFSATRQRPDVPRSRRHARGERRGSPSRSRRCSSPLPRKTRRPPRNKLSAFSNSCCSNKLSKNPYHCLWCECCVNFLLA